MPGGNIVEQLASGNSHWDSTKQGSVPSVAFSEDSVPGGNAHWYNMPEGAALGSVPGDTAQRAEQYARKSAKWPSASGNGAKSSAQWRQME